MNLGTTKVRSSGSPSKNKKTSYSEELGGKGPPLSPGGCGDLVLSIVERTEVVPRSVGRAQERLAEVADLTVVKEKAGHRDNVTLRFRKGEGALEGSQLLVHCLLVRVADLGFVAPLQVKMPVGSEDEATVRLGAADKSMGGVDGHIEPLHGVVLNQVLTTPNSVAGHWDHVRSKG